MMGIYELAKDAVSIASKADNIELYKMLIDVQKESLELLEENRQLKLKIKELEGSSEFTKLLTFKYNCYYKPDDKNFDEPFCTNCWDNNNKLIRMHKYEDSIGPRVTCNVCKVDLPYKKR